VSKAIGCTHGTNAVPSPNSATGSEDQRDAVLEQDAPDAAERMVQALVLLRSIGAQTATVLVYEAFVRQFSSGKVTGHLSRSW
jgi:hypothetical protein